MLSNTTLGKTKWKGWSVKSVSVELWSNTWSLPTSLWQSKDIYQNKENILKNQLVQNDYKLPLHNTPDKFKNSKKKMYDKTHKVLRLVQIHHEKDSYSL